MADARGNINVSGLEEYLANYVRVCNYVLEANENRFPFLEIWRAGEESLTGMSIEFSTSNQSETAVYAVVFHQKRLNSIGPALAACLPKHHKKLHFDYVLAVLTEPYKYITNPSLIDWDWMSRNKNKTGL
ncbi:hypothetical protein [Kordiimonas pumila]|uniref:Uncharacterized protein n=1 Tax=Kordiimonas pumila TaxID=2161677 RepID=A0ABV7D716_9PROT|nr:hypothetical protein [Kordiimonas pumila]